MEKKLFWIEQRYVFPVVAETEAEAERTAYNERMAIAREVAPSSFGQYYGGKSLTERDGWYRCLPYGLHDGRNVEDWEPSYWPTKTGE